MVAGGESLFEPIAAVGGFEDGGTQLDGVDQAGGVNSRDDEPGLAVDFADGESAARSSALRRSASS